MQSSALAYARAQAELEAKKKAKEAEKETAAEQKKTAKTKKLAEMCIALLKDPLADLKKTCANSPEPDEYTKKSCALLLERCADMMTKSVQTMTDGTPLDFEMHDIKLVQADLIGKTRTRVCWRAFFSYIYI